MSPSPVSCLCGFLCAGYSAWGTGLSIESSGSRAARQPRRLCSVIRRGVWRLRLRRGAGAVVGGRGDEGQLHVFAPEETREQVAKESSPWQAYFLPSGVQHRTPMIDNP